MGDTKFSNLAHAPIPQFDLKQGSLLKEGSDLSQKRLDAAGFLSGTSKDRVLAQDAGLDRAIREYRHLNFDYYCGSQAAIYFGDVWVDEVVAVGWNVNPNKVPIYSYCGRLYETIALGPVEVTGSFAVNFKEAAYLKVIMAYLKGQWTYNTAAVADNPELEKHRDTREAARRGDKNVYVKDAQSRSLNPLLNAPDNVFMDMARWHQDALWDPTNQQARGERFDTSGHRANAAFAGTGPMRDPSLRPDEYPHFDLYATFGNVEEATAPSTVVRIHDVELTGSSMQYSIDGSPILEHYSFIGRNIS